MVLIINKYNYYPWDSAYFDGHWLGSFVGMLVVIRVKHMVVIDLGLDLGKYQLFGGCVMSRKTWPEEAPSIKISPQIYYDTYL